MWKINQMLVKNFWKHSFFFSIQKNLKHMHNTFASVYCFLTTKAALGIARIAGEKRGICILITKIKKMATKDTYPLLFYHFIMQTLYQCMQISHKNPHGALCLGWKKNLYGKKGFYFNFSNSF